MITLPITVTEAQLLLLVFIRLSVILFMLPFFDSNYISLPVRASLTLFISLILVYYGTIPAQSILSFSTPQLIMLVAQELLFGLSLGICMNIIFTAIKMGVEFLNGQMGFSMAQMVDPTYGTTAGVSTNFFSMISILFFLVMNGHIVLLRAIAESFTVLPVGQFSITPQVANDVLIYSGTIFSTALKIASPVIAALFLVDLAIALVGRAVPTMNLMLFGFPIKIGVGFTFLILLLSILSNEFQLFIFSIPKIVSGISAMGFLQ